MSAIAVMERPAERDRAPFWNEDRIKACHRLFIAEKRSATDVARELGAVSRHAVLGLAFRKGWDRPIEVAHDNARNARRRRQEQNPARVKPLRRRQRRVARRPAAFVGRVAEEACPPGITTLPPDTIAVAPRPWLTRDAGQCAYPAFGDGDETMSCCNPTGSPTVSYCAGHHAVMFVPTKTTMADLVHSVRRFA